jgi:hypothetical protein
MEKSIKEFFFVESFLFDFLPVCCQPNLNQFCLSLVTKKNTIHFRFLFVTLKPSPGEGLRLRCEFVDNGWASSYASQHLRGSSTVHIRRLCCKGEEQKYSLTNAELRSVGFITQVYSGAVMYIMMASQGLLPGRAHQYDSHVLLHSPETPVAGIPLTLESGQVEVVGENV